MRSVALNDSKALSQARPCPKASAFVAPPHGRVARMIATTSSNPRHSSSSNAAVIALAAFALAGLCSCGGGSSPAQPLPASTPTPTPAPTPTPSLASQLPPGLVCDPTPPPLHALRL